MQQYVSQKSFVKIEKNKTISDSKKEGYFEKFTNHLHNNSNNREAETLIDNY